MSVIAMGQSASNPTRRTSPAGESDSERALRVIATYIPSEALAAYLALIGILVPAAGTPSGQVFAVKLLALGASLALAVGLVFLGFTPGANDDQLTVRRKRAQLIGFAVVALLAYSLATPGGPWDGSVLGVALTVWGAAIVLLLAPLLPVIAGRWGLRP